MTDSQRDSRLVYVGAYTAPSGKAEGIHIYRLDARTGALTPAGVAPGITNPSFLALSPDRRYLYAANETAEFAGQPGGGVSALAIDRSTGALTLLNQQPTHGGSPCYVSVDQTGRWALVANYSGGNLAVFPIAKDGSLGAASAIIQHQGSSVHPQRQTHAYAHSVILAPGNRFALAADLGMDKIMIYRFDAATGALAANDQPWLSLHPGAGPRHLAFDPAGRYLYVANEIDSTASALAYDGQNGHVRHLQTLSTLPPGFAGANNNTCADIHLSPSGRWLYVSNRGHDSIAVFAIDPATGLLSSAGHTSTQGHTPRNFALVAGSNLLLAANQRSDSIVAFHIDDETGQLSPTGAVSPAPTPVCVCVM